MLKKWISLFSVFCMMITMASLASCDDKNTGSGGAGGSTGKMIKTEGGLEIPEIKLEKKKVRIISVDNGNHRADGRVTAFFSKYYGGEIEQIITAPTEYYTTLISEVNAGDPPELCEMNGGFPSLAQQGVVQSADELNIDFSLDFMSPLKSTYEQYVYNGKHYFLPWVSNPQNYVYFNTKIFEDNDYTTPYDLYKADKWTWDQFIDAARKLTVTKDGKIERYGIAWEEWHASRLFYTTGEQIVKFNGDKPVLNLDNPNYSRAATMMGDIAVKYKVLFPNKDMASVSDAFDSGKAAMIIGPNFLSGTDSFATSIKQTKQFGWAPMPKDPKADKHYVPGSDIGFFIAKGCKNYDALNAFMISSVGAFAEMKNKDSAAYKTEKEKFMKTWSEYGYTDEDYNYIQEVNESFNKLVRVPDIYRDILDLNDIGIRLTGSMDGTPRTYQQIIAELVPFVQEKLDQMYK